MEKIRCIAVDDNAEALSVVKRYITLAPELELVASFNDSLHALSFMKTDKTIDMVFLDQEMPDLTGLEFVDILEDSLTNPPYFIFTTGHTDCAIPLYDYYHVIGFLEKPIDQRRFLKAIRKAAHLLQDRPVRQLNAKSEYLMIETSVKNQKTIYKVAYSDIILIESVKNHITFVTATEQITVRAPLTTIENTLPGEVFIRTHRSFIINHWRLSKIINRERIIVMDNGHRVPIGKIYYKKVYQDLVQGSLRDIN
jgi:DNA-binding LytR/AlgR family response regulator